MGKRNRYQGITSVLEKMTNLLILNFLFLVSCIPIITIGAAMTALYDVTMKMTRNEEGYIVRSYIKSMKSNFKRSLMLSVTLSIVFLILYTIITSIGNTNNLVLIMIKNIVLCITLIFWMAVGYVFPLQAKFENTLKRTLINSVLMAMKHTGQTAIIVLLNSFVLLIRYFNTTVFVVCITFYMLIGLALIAYINSMMFRKIFDQYIT